MIFVILALGITLTIVGAIVIDSMTCEFVGGAAVAIGLVASLIAIIVIIVLCCNVTGLRTIDNRIEMYQEENTRIEEQIAEVVKQYQVYETDIFTEIAPDSSITLVALYPELKSDTLVQSQIDVYIKNNEKIKSLKETKINGTVNRWWLYFGK